MTADFPRSETAVVILHGFTGSPVSMQPIADACVSAEIPVRMPLLPGHGTTWQDLNRTTYADWLAAAQSAVDDAASRYERVYVIGLSMGGTLTLDLALANPRLAGISLINPALFFHDPRLVFLRFLKQVLGSVDGIADDIAKPGVSEGAYTRTPLKALHSLVKAMARTRERLWQVTCPTLIFSSATDHVVPTGSPQMAYRRISSRAKRLVILHRSYHVATLDYDGPLIVEDFLSFVRNGTP